MARLPARALVLDGEIVCAVENGRADFNALQDDLKRKRYDRLAYYAFDLLHLDAFDVRCAPLIERKRTLQAFFAEANGRATRVLYVDHYEDGAALYEAVCALGLEGVVSKRSDAPYRSGRTESWLKVKCLRRERFVVIGFAPESGGGIAKLRLARQDGRAGLRGARGHRMEPQERCRDQAASDAPVETYVPAAEAPSSARTRCGSSRAFRLR